MQSSADEDAAKVLDSLRRIVRALRMTAHSLEQRFGISGAQLFVMQQVAAEPGASIRRISERTLTDASSVSVVVARLVARDLIARRQAQADARKSELTLTATGRRLLRRAREPFQARLVRELRALPRPRLRRLSSDLAAIVQRVGVEKGAAPMFFDDSRATKTVHGW